MFHGKYPAKAYSNGQHTGPGPWLDLIRAANGFLNNMFGAPDDLGPWWAGGQVEEYEHARVIHHDSETVSVVAKTEVGSEALTKAEEQLKG